MEDSQKTDILSRVSYSTDINDISEVDFMIEAVTENFELKKEIFEQAAELTKDHAILASNTSSIRITKLAECVPAERAPQVIGMHFGDPQPLMKQVVIINGQ